MTKGKELSRSEYTPTKVPVEILRAALDLEVMRKLVDFDDHLEDS
jgi:hypothetical protein